MTFDSTQVTLSGSGGTQPFTLGDLGPGSYTPSDLQFLDSATFSNAVFQATLSQTSFQLSDGTTFLASSSALSATLDPSSGNSLAPGVDLVVLSVSGEVVATPEPRYGVFIAALVGFVAFIKSKAQATFFAEKPKRFQTA